MKNNAIIIAVLGALLLGLGGGYWFANQYTSPLKSPLVEKTGPTPLFYRHPMNPGMTSPTPAKDEMGMDYVPVFAEGEKASDAPKGTVKIDPVTTQNIGVRTAAAEVKTLSRNIRAVGRVDYDEEHLTRLHPKTEGWIEQLYIDKTGEPVSEDTLLLSIYSPQLVSSQQEYLLALDNRKILADSPIKIIREGAEMLVASARERLTLLDVPEHQIAELEKDRQIKRYLHIHSPFDGFVLNIGARRGQYVTPATELYRIAGLAKVWVYVDLYEYELPWVKTGDTGEMTLTALPGETFTGEITYIYPYVEAKTRTIKVRLEFDNKKGLLKPDMYAEVAIQAAREIDAVVVPSEAILRAGERERVFVARENGKFEPRDVNVGIETDRFSQILEGIRPGEKVVTSAQFLIDSESRLNEAVSKMLSREKEAPPQTEPAHSMQDMKKEDGHDSQNH